MLREILRPIEGDLQSVQDKIQKNLLSRAGCVGSFAHLEVSYLNQVIRPALVILAGRLFNYSAEKTIMLAGIFQFIYMASQIHAGISDSDSDENKNYGSKFPVLVGDYLYGKFFTFLCDAGIIRFLQPLAEIICSINEGRILKQNAGGAYDTHPLIFKEIISKEMATLFAGCCRLGACLSSAEEENQKYLYRFGFNLGVAYGMMEQGDPFKQGNNFFHCALAELERVPAKPERDVLAELVRFLSGNGVASRRLVG